LNSEVFAPLDSWFAADSSKRLYLAGPSFGIEDAKFFYFAYLVNAMGYVFEGSSFIEQQHGHLYKYLRRCSENDIYHQAVAYLDINPGFHIKVMVGKFKSMGMNMHEEKVKPEDIPVFAGFEYCEVREPKEEWGRVEAAAATPPPTESLQDFLASLSLEKFFLPLVDNDVSTKAELSTLEDEDLMDEEIGMRKLQVNKLRRALKREEGGEPTTAAPTVASLTSAGPTTAAITITGLERVVKKKVSDSALLSLAYHNSVYLNTN
jgi:hypothetical protein